MLTKYSKSLALREHYISSLKEGTYVSDLLDFTFDFLGLKKGKPFDVSKLRKDVTSPFLLAADGVNGSDIAHYGTMSALENTQWLLCRIYYQCLHHIPSMAKAWWLESKSRQLTSSVESWTAKFISPSITSTVLNTVGDWSKAQNPSANEKAITVRISLQSSTVSASYPIDDSECAISITLPPSFPLNQAVVNSINRIAIDERRWQSWLRTTQATIAFSNNNIVDGLVVWRRNVEGQLKGQTECAICYSIVAEDGKLPNKKCRTCKNTFHGSCLFKWFRTSGGATCPLCRSAFNYG